MENLTEKIRENWMLIVFVAGVILWYGSTNSRLTRVEAQVQEQVTSGESDSQKISQLVTDVAVIKQILSTQTVQTVSTVKTANNKIDDLNSKIDFIIKKIQ